MLPIAHENSKKKAPCVSQIQIDPQRHLVYVRGQVPGPAGSFVYLRDAYNTTPEFRAAWGLPFPTSTEKDLASLPVTVWRNTKDPYRMYTEETDYFPITVSGG